jgi:hypothetical protein
MDLDTRFSSRFFQKITKALNIETWISTQYHYQTNGQVERRIRTLKQLMRFYVNKRQNNWCEALPKIAAALNGAPHESLGMSPYQALYGRPYRVLPALVHSATKVPAADEMISNHEANRREIELALNHARFRQTVQAQKKRGPQQEWSPGQRVLIYGKAYNPPKGRSRKLLPRWFGPFSISEYDAYTQNYKLDLGARYKRQKPWFHSSVLKLYQENDNDKFPSRTFSRPEPIFIESQEEWEVQQILDHRLQQNRHEFLIRWKGYPPEDDSWEPLENLKGSQEAIAEFWKENQMENEAPKISTHYIRRAWSSMTVSVTTPKSSEDIPEFWDPYSDGEYDSSGDDIYEEETYFNPQNEDEMLWHQES